MLKQIQQQELISFIIKIFANNAVNVSLNQYEVSSKSRQLLGSPVELPLGLYLNNSYKKWVDFKCRFVTALLVCK